MREMELTFFLWLQLLIQAFWQHSDLNVITGDSNGNDVSVDFAGDFILQHQRGTETETSSMSWPDKLDSEHEDGWLLETAMKLSVSRGSNLMDTI